jgi:chromosome partitioning protein
VDKAVLMATVIAVVNQKGGVAKTTTVANLACALVERGRTVLAIDCDPQASLTFSLGQDERALERAGKTLQHALLGGRELADLVVGGSPALVPAGIGLARADAELIAEPGASWVLKEKLAPLREAYEVVLIDCPPTLTLLTVNALAAADRVLIPVKTDLLSTLGIPQLLDTIAKVQRRANPKLTILGILPTMLNPQYGHDTEVLDEIRSSFGQRLRVFDPVRRSTGFDKAVGGGRPLVLASPTSPGAEAYRKLAGVIEEMLNAPA